LHRLGAVLHDLRQCAGIDVVEIAEDVDMLRRAGMRPDQRGVAPQRGLIVLDADAAPIIEFGYVRIVLVPVGVDDAIGGKGRGAAMGVVNDATRLPDASRMTSPGNTSSPNSLATASGIPAALGS
jgi:hypothetical protein